MLCRSLPVCLLLAVATPALAQDETPVVITNDTPPADSWRIWARGEYLLWFIRGDHSPVPLATTGPAGTAHAGALDQPATSVLIGPDLNYKPDSGGRLTIGGWLDNAATIGVEGSGFCLETHTIHKKYYSNRTDGAPVIARPFFNTLTGQQDAEVITAPGDALGGRYLGGIDLFSDSRTWGGELNMLFNLASGSQGRLDLVGGFRYLAQKDQFRSDQSSTVLTPGTVAFAGAPAPAPDIVSLRDFIETDNNFYGGQLGLQGELTRGRWIIASSIKAGLGANQEQLETIGRTLLTNSAGVSLNQSGGLFVPPNLDQLYRTRIGFMSEFNVRIAYRITDHWTASAGYTFLYWTNIIRPGSQIDAAIDPRTVPYSLSFNPNVAPAPFQLHATEFWAQGLTFGLECRY
jgi:Putative beta barrel porin-7 (BBP7)